MRAAAITASLSKLTNATGLAAFASSMMTQDMVRASVQQAIAQRFPTGVLPREAMVHLGLASADSNEVAASFIGHLFGRMSAGEKSALIAEVMPLVNGKTDLVAAASQVLTHVPGVAKLLQVLPTGLRSDTAGAAQLTAGLGRAPTALNEVNAMLGSDPTFPGRPFRRGLVRRLQPTRSA